MDLVLKIEKINVGIRITSSGYSVCRFSTEIDNFDYFGPNFLKNGFRVVYLEN